jgi:peptide/nickel transport system substrate-binding protein
MPRIRLATALFAAAAVVATVAPHASYAQASKIIITDPQPPKANWAMETDDAFTLSRAGCLEALARIDFDVKLQPSLATSWKQVNPTAWDFSIRKGVKFHDGQELNAAAVVKSLNHVLSAAAPARAFNPKVVSSVEAIDQYTVRISTPKPSVLLPYRLASPNTGILSPAAYKGRKVNPIEACTGPFVLKEEIPNQLLKLVRNETYWAGPVGVAEAEVHFIIDANVRVTQIKSGEAQISRFIPLSARESLDKLPEVKIYAREIPRTLGLYLNNKRPPFNNPLIRKAIQAGIDVKAIAASIYEGFARPAIGPFAPDEPWAPPIQPVTRDVTRAKALLAEAGIGPGELKLELRAYSSRPELKDVAAVVQQQLKAIGVPVEIIITDWAGLEPLFLAGTYDMAFMSRGHQLDVADPIGFLQADYTCEGSFNVTHYCDPKVDALLDQASVMVDAGQRHDIYRKVARILQEEAVNVFIVHNQETNAVSARVQNYRLHPLNHYYLTKDLTIAPR